MPPFAGTVPRRSIAFITFYDVICIGARLLLSIAKENGIKPCLISFKMPAYRRVTADLQDYSGYQIYIDGIKFGTCYAVSPYSRKEMNLLVQLLKELNPDLICLSTRSFALSLGRTVFRHLKESGIQAQIIGGGWGPTLEPGEFLEFCDYVCFGEGEKPFRQICQRLNEGSCDFSDVPNMIYYSGNRLQRTPVVAPVSDEEMNHLAFPDFAPESSYLIDDNRISRPRMFTNDMMSHCFAGRGCPLSCTYCMSSKYRDLYLAHGHSIKKHRVRKPETVIAEIEVRKRQGARFININDEVFPTDRDWIMRFLALYRERIGLPFFANVNELHDPELVKDMVGAGLCSTVVGIQSGSERIRKQIFRRMIPVAKLEAFAASVAGLGISVAYHLIHHNPFDTEEDMDETLQLLYRLPFASSVKVYRLTPFPGSPMEKLISDSDVTPIPKKLHEWYGYLFTLAAKGPFRRKICRFIHKRRLIRPGLLICRLLFHIEFLSTRRLKNWRNLGRRMVRRCLPTQT